MNIKKWFLPFIGVTVLAAASSAVTFSLMSRFFRPPAAPGGLSGSLHDWAHQIKLTKEQQGKLEPLETGLKKDLQTIQPELAAARLQVCAALSQKDVKEGDLEKLIARIADLEREQQRHVVRHLFGMKRILTPEQQRAFFTMIMRSICEDCRSATGSDKDMCGHCRIVADASTHEQKG